MDIEAGVGSPIRNRVWHILRDSLLFAASTCLAFGFAWYGILFLFEAFTDESELMFACAALTSSGLFSLVHEAIFTYLPALEICLGGRIAYELQEEAGFWTRALFTVAHNELGGIGVLGTVEALVALAPLPKAKIFLFLKTCSSYFAGFWLWYLYEECLKRDSIFRAFEEGERERTDPGRHLRHLSNDDFEAQMQARGLVLLQSVSAISRPSSNDHGTPCLCELL
jgi:hypothetical protein